MKIKMPLFITGPKIGGLQITDFALLYAFPLDNDIRLYSRRLPPGVLREGRILDEERFSRALRELHAAISPAEENRVLEVTVSLPASLIFVQNFTIPFVERKKVAELAELNLKSISPIEESRVAMDWQFADETHDRYDLLGAFIEREYLEKIKNILEAANFYPAAFEFPSLSFSRIFREERGILSVPVLILLVSTDGVNIFIIRNGVVYFDYFQSWRSIQGDKQWITLFDFKSVIITEVRKVITFTLSRFQAKINEAYIVVPGYEAEIQRILRDEFQIAARPFVMTSWRARAIPFWSVAVGAALRDSEKKLEQKSINLGTGSFSNVWLWHRAFSFFALWRNIFIAGFFFLFVIFFASTALLVKEKKYLTIQEREFNLRIGEEEFQRFQAKSVEFNTLVRKAQKATETRNPWAQFLTVLSETAAEHGIRIDRITVTHSQDPVLVSARAPSNDEVVSFKNALAALSGIREVNLPISRIVPADGNAVTFDISFRIEW